MRVRYTPFDQLPERIRKKVRIEGTNERAACWIWTASFTKARQRWAKPRTKDDGRDRGFDTRQGTFVVQKPVPNLHCTELGYATAAHRVIFSECFNTPIRDVPALARCGNDQCVSPWHSRPAGVVWREEALPTEAQPGSYTWDRCLALLRAADGGMGVSTSVDRLTAADEAGIPPDQLTDACWAAYCASVDDDEDE